ncbi:hypothetical protein [Kitasatospora azatica]|uniref:hypothetical protein n=1 Tax=Kitasatospora azatica TaxID=58347 RepID=UPI000568BF49|nr:hypothetical protein [Kitasatospora azatica]
MSGKYYVMADEERNGTWAFAPDQVEQALTAHWPQAQMAGPMGQFDVFDLTVSLDDSEEPVELTYYANRRFFAFADQDPLDAPFRVIFTVLSTLSQETPVVWTTDWDATPHRVDLSVGLPELLRPFEL